MNAISNVYALFLSIIILSLLATHYLVTIERMNSDVSSLMGRKIEYVKDLANQPILSLKYDHGKLGLAIKPISPIKISYLFAEFHNGTVLFRKVDRLIYNDTILYILNNYNGSPIRLGIITENGIIEYYNPLKDPVLQGLSDINKYADGYINKTLITKLINNQLSEFYNPVTGNISRVIVFDGNESINYYKLNNPIHINITIKNVDPARIEVYSPVRKTIHVNLHHPGKQYLFSLKIENYTIDVYYITYYKTYSWSSAISTVGLTFKANTNNQFILYGWGNVYLSKERVNDQTVSSIDKNKAAYPLLLTPTSSFTGKVTAKHRTEYISSEPHYMLYLEGNSIGYFLTNNILVLAYNYYTEYENYIVGPDMLIEANLTIYGYEIINYSYNPAIVKVPRQFYYMESNYINIKSANTVSTYISALWNIGCSYKPIKIWIPIGEEEYITRYAALDQYTYAVDGDNYISAEPIEPSQGYGPFLQVILNTSISNQYSCLGYEACRTIYLNTEQAPTTLGAPLPRLLLIKDARTRSIIENYIPRKPFNKQVKIFQHELSDLSTTTYVQAYSNISFTVYNPYNTSLKITVYRIKDNQLLFNIFGIQPDTTYIISPGENKIVVDLEPGTYLFEITPVKYDLRDPDTLDTVLVESLIVVII